MTKHYWMSKENGNLLKWDEILQDAEENGYDDITDPTSVEYLHIELHYTRTEYTYD